MYFCTPALLQISSPLIFQHSVVRVMVAEVFVGGWHMLALHVAHSSPLSTAKQIWYVIMSFFDLSGPDGLPKYFHLHFFPLFNSFPHSIGWHPGADTDMQCSPGNWGSN